MVDRKNLFASGLCAKLKEKIFGKITVSTTKYDTLIVGIETFGGLVYSVQIENLADKILNGYSIEDATDDIVEKYKKFVVSIYLK